MTWSHGNHVFVRNIRIVFITLQLSVDEGIDGLLQNFISRAEHIDEKKKGVKVVWNITCGGLAQFGQGSVLCLLTPKLDSPSL